MNPVELDRAWYVFAIAPDRLSWRHFPAYIRDYDVDRRITRMRHAGTWPPVVDVRQRWRDVDALYLLCGNTEPLMLALPELARSNKTLLAFTE